MKILWFVPHEFEAVAGGAWIQINSMYTTLNAQSSEIQVDYYSPGMRIEDYDLVHLFRADFSLWPLSVYLQKHKIPYWVTPIFYSKHSAQGIRARLQISSLVSRVLRGMRSNYDYTCEIIQGAQRVLANTQDEMDLIQDAFQVSASQLTWLKNGIAPHFFQAPPSTAHEELRKLLPEGLEHFDLCTGVLGHPRKNTLELVKAYAQSQRKLLLIGDLGEDDYSQQCLRVIQSSDQIHRLPKMDPSSLLYRSALTLAHTYVQPSLFETPGLSALEAAASGTRVAVTAFGGPRQYFQDYAQYFHDLSAAGILQIISQWTPIHQKSSLAPEARSHFEQFQWDVVVKELGEMYLRR